MARKTCEVAVPEGGFGRDAGKVFVLTEMAATQAESWAIRALGAAVKGGMDVSEDAMAMGMLGITLFTMQGILRAPYDSVGPLLAEMMECVTFKAPAATRPLVEDDIEEVQTRLFLRDEVLKLHTGFSPAAELAKAAAAAVAMRDAFSNTPMSPDESEP